MNPLAIVGGTGIDRFEAVKPVRCHDVLTPYGAPSGEIREGEWGGQRVFLLQRHGAQHCIPPHLINYRANVWALQAVGASAIVAINAVGGIGPDAVPGQLLIPDQLIDYTWGRDHTFDDGRDGQLRHIDFTQPYDPVLREALLTAAGQIKIEPETSGVQAVMQGPRLETAAEIQRLHRDGCDVVGMTGMPEAALARELGLPYASICMVVNPAAGLGDEPLTLAMMGRHLASTGVRVQQLLAALLAGGYCP